MNRCALLAASMLTLAVSGCAAQVTTSQYNNSRTAATLHEKILTPRNVNAQPLYVPAVPIPGRETHDVLYVATEHDSVYAFDANRPGDPPLWKVSFLDQSTGGHYAFRRRCGLPVYSSGGWHHVHPRDRPQDRHALRARPHDDCPPRRR